MFNEYDRFFMSRALKLAALGRGSVEPNPMVGAVIVRPDLLPRSSESLSNPNEVGLSKKNVLKQDWNDSPEQLEAIIVGEGYHQKFGESHAEVLALKKAGKRAKNSILYVTLEPCCHFGKTPPCTEAIIKAGVRKVFIAMKDPFPKVDGSGIKQLQEAGIEVVCGLCEEESQNLNAPYLTRLTKHRPWIIGKWAMTLDGKMATRTGSSYWISSEESRQQVHQIRSRMDGIMIGSRTAMEDDPKLTVRLPQGQTPLRTPTRIIFDSGGTLSVFSELALSIRDVPLLLVFGPETPKEKADFWRDKGAEVLVLNVPTHEQRLILLLENLAERGLTNILVEGGGKLLGHLFDLEYLDEVIVFIAPKIVGGENAIVPVGGFGCDHMKMATRLIDPEVETFGSDIMISGRLDYKKIK